MEITISNRIRLKNPPDTILNLLVERLRIPNPKWLEAQSAGRSLYRIEQYITNFIMLPDDSILIPRGMFSWIKEKAKEFGIEYTVIDSRTKFEHIDIDSSKIRYRPYQFDAVLALITESSEGVLVAPAGSGKTVMGLSLIPLVGQPTLWLTHTGPLANQAVERASSFLPDIGEIGMIGRGEWKKGEVLTVALIQTLVRNQEQLIKMRNDFGMVILDEAHHCPARTFLEVVCHFNPYYLYGLTATPYRRDKLEVLMFQTLGETKTIISNEKVSRYGGIVQPKILHREIKSERVESNNIQMILKKFIINNKQRNQTIVDDVVSEASQGHYCIVVSDRREHCETLCSMITEKWPKTGIATGKYSKKYVQEQVDRYNNEDITVLVATFALLGEGFDVPFLDRAFLAMPFRSETKAEQLIGRIQRSHPGKTDAVVYDYVDSNIGVLKNQFFNKTRDCRFRTYKRLGLEVELP